MTSYSGQSAGVTARGGGVVPGLPATQGGAKPSRRAAVRARPATAGAWTRPPRRFGLRRVCAPYFIFILTPDVLPAPGDTAGGFALGTSGKPG